MWPYYTHTVHTIITLNKLPNYYKLYVQIGIILNVYSINSSCRHYILIFLFYILDFTTSKSISSSIIAFIYLNAGKSTANNDIISDIQLHTQVPHLTFNHKVNFYKVPPKIGSNYLAIIFHENDKQISEVMQMLFSIIQTGLSLELSTVKLLTVYPTKQATKSATINYLEECHYHNIVDCILIFMNKNKKICKYTAFMFVINQKHPSN